MKTLAILTGAVLLAALPHTLCHPVHHLHPRIIPGAVPAGAGAAPPPPPPAPAHPHPHINFSKANKVLHPILP